MRSSLSTILAYAALAAAGPVSLNKRVVDQLNQEAFEEAHQRDNGATRALTNAQITTADGRCLFVDILSGDFRANLTPVQVAACGATDGQGWDVITSGLHNNVAGQALIVSTLSGACFNFDPRRAAGNQFLLFSCGGRAAGEGQVTDSQLFAFSGNGGSQTLTPRNAAGKCLVVKGNVVDIADCNANDANQVFNIGGGGAAAPPADEVEAPAETTPVEVEAPAETTPAEEEPAETTPSPVIETLAPEETTPAPPAATTTTAGRGKGKGKGKGRGRITRIISDCGAAPTVTVTEVTTVTAAPGEVAAPAVPEPEPEPEFSTTEEVLVTSFITPEPTATATLAPPAEEVTTTAPPAVVTTPAAPPAGGAGTIPGVLNFQPTEAVPVSRAGGVLQPTAVAESHVFDAGATRAFTKVNIVAPNGQCLFVDPQAGDFRENLIPVGLADCAGSPNELWDVITAGTHNNGRDGGALLVSSFMNGCISFDGRRQPDDRVTIFSCGGRANGEGETNAGQLITFPQADERKLTFAPISERGATCMTAGAGRVGSAPCANDGSNVFTIV